MLVRGFWHLPLQRKHKCRSCLASAVRSGVDNGLVGANTILAAYMATQDLTAA